MQQFTQEERNELAEKLHAGQREFEHAKEYMATGQEILALNLIEKAHSICDRVIFEFRQRGY